MSEKDLVFCLADESEKMLNEPFDGQNQFDTEIGRWKDIHPQSITFQNAGSEIPGFRIRKVICKRSLSRSNSTKSSLCTAGNILNGSSLKGIQNNTKKKTESIFRQSGFTKDQPARVKIYQQPKVKKNRKPIKALKLPNVNQENDE